MMRPAAVLWILGALLGGAPATALDEWKVDKGTTGLLVEDHRVPLLFLTIEFPAGSFSPWVEEHDAEVAFEVQLQDTPGELRRRADLLAADVQLGTGKRASLLSLACRKEDAPAALDLVRAILANRDFDRAELGRLRQTRRLSWATSQREPQFVLRQAVTRLLFAADDPRRRAYEKPDLRKKDVASLIAARDVLIRLPGRLVGFAGDLTPQEARRLAQGLLPEPAPDLPPDLAPQFGPLATAGKRPPSAIVHLPRLTQVYFAYGRESLGWRDPDYPASVIADHALGGHFNSRLMIALRQEGGDTYGASVRDLGDVDPGAWGMASFTRTDNARAMERKLRDVLERFHAEGITEPERALAAGHAVGRRAFTRQSPATLLQTAMYERRYGLPFGFFDEQARQAAGLTLAEVNAFISKFYDPTRFTMVVLHPK